MRIPFFVLVSFAFLAFARPALAQGEQPTDTPIPTITLTPSPTFTPLPTATPGYWEAVPVSSGHEVILERRITYGEIAIVIGLLALLGFLSVIAFIAIPRLWP